MFDIKGKLIILNTDDLAIPPFKDHYNKAKDKQLALKEIEYIIWLYRWNTPYEAYPEKERSWRVAEAVFGDKNYQPSEEVVLLGNKFIELLETPATRLLSASKAAAEYLTESLKAFSKETVDIDVAMKITKLLKDVGNVVVSLDTTAKKAKAEQLETGRVKGGGQIGLYE